ncbi:hypothetical protein QQ045_011962 [Rhodiola kirilowii]
MTCKCTSFCSTCRDSNLRTSSKTRQCLNLLAKWQARKGCTASQLALAWVYHQVLDVCPIPGTTKIENLKSNIDALSVSLTAEEMAELEALTSIDTVKGDNYSFGMPTWKTSDTPLLYSCKA